MRIAFLCVAIYLVGAYCQAADTCSTDKLVGSCEAMQKLGANVNGAKELALPKFQDGSTIYNDLGLKRASKNDFTEPSPAQKQRAIAISEKIRASSIALIVGDTRKEYWTSEQKAMVARLKSVRLVMANHSEESCNSSPVSKVDPNASYNAWTHSLVICSPVAKLAPAALTMLMAHEFGHVVSPCTMSRDQYTVSSEKIASTSSIQRCLGGKQDVEFAQTMFPGGASNANFSTLENLSPRYRNVVSKLSNCGAITKNPEESRIKEAGVFSKLAGCLSSSYQTNHKNYLKVSSGNSGPSKGSGPPADSKNLQCMGIFEEHFAEAVGSKVFASMLGSDGKQKDDAKVGLVQMMGYACGEKSRPKEDPGKMFRYPTSTDRVQIQMADPAMQAALGCEAPKTSVCTVDEVNTGATTSSAPNQQKGSAQ